MRTIGPFRKVRYDRRERPSLRLTSSKRNEAHDQSLHEVVVHTRRLGQPSDGFQLAADHADANDAFDAWASSS